MPRPSGNFSSFGLRDHLDDSGDGISSGVRERLCQFAGIVIIVGNRSDIH